VHGALMPHDSAHWHGAAIERIARFDATDSVEVAEKWHGT